MNKRDRQEKTLFPVLLTLQMASLVLDIICTFVCFGPNRIIFETSHYLWWLPDTIWRLYVISTAFFTMHFALHIIEVCGSGPKKLSDKVFTVVRSIMIFMIVIDVLVIIYFNPVYTDESSRFCFIWGIGALIHTLIIGAFMASIVAFVLLYRSNLRKLQLISILTGLACVGIFYILEITMEVLVLGFSISILITLVYFNWENPDIKYISQLSEAKQQAFEANQSKTDFLASMSHEIRTPINVISGMGEMILRESNEQQTLEYAQKIQSASRFLLSLVNDILDISKVEVGKLEVHPTTFQTKPLFVSIIEDVSSRAQDKGLALVTRISDKIPSALYGDDIRLRQIFTNLLTNAIKYTEKGTINFTVDYNREGDIAILHASVKDTGFGIKPDNMDKIFEVFGRVDDSKTHYIQGTGLGLPITKQLLGKMGADLKVKSTYGIGSEFYFSLKLKIMSSDTIGNIFTKNAVAEKIPEKTGPSFIAPDAKILAVDDNSTNLFVLQAILKRLRVQFESVTSGRAALEKIENNRYDIIFLDHMMPEMDGIQTLQKMKENPVFTSLKTPVVALTANAINGARETYLDAGFSDYLSKPIDPANLEKIMLKYLPEHLIK